MKKKDFTKNYYFFFIFRAIVPHCSERVSYKLIDITKSMTFPVVVKGPWINPKKSSNSLSLEEKDSSNITLSI